VAAGAIVGRAAIASDTSRLSATAALIALLITHALLAGLRFIPSVRSSTKRRGHGGHRLLSGSVRSPCRRPVRTCMLPYDLGTAAAFSYARFNGRSLLDNVMDVMLSVLTNSPLGTGIRPDLARFTDRFPYLCGTSQAG
jgi:hypothetical protein